MNILITIAGESFTVPASLWLLVRPEGQPGQQGQQAKRIMRADAVRVGDWITLGLVGGRVVYGRVQFPPEGRGAATVTTNHGAT